MVLVISFLNHPGDADKIHLVWKRKTTGDGRTGEDEDINLFPGEMSGDCHGTPDMSQPIGVMGIHEDVIDLFFRHVQRLEKKMMDIIIIV